MHKTQPVTTTGIQIEIEFWDKLLLLQMNLCNELWNKYIQCREEADKY
jgi:hypothetical protein